MQISDPPNVISTPSGRIEVKLGSVFEIVCEARGIPYPIISWRQSEHPSSSTQLENNRRKLIEVSNRSMAGKIECIATNGVGQPATAGVDMVVYCMYLYILVHIRNFLIEKFILCELNRIQLNLKLFVSFIYFVLHF